MTPATSRAMSSAITIEKLNKVTYDLLSLWIRGSKWLSVGLKKNRKIKKNGKTNLELYNNGLKVVHLDSSYD